MSYIKDLSIACKEGKTMEAYQRAKANLNAYPKNIWVQRGLGWVLHYMIKSDTIEHNLQNLLLHLNEFATLELLTVQNDGMLFERLLWELAKFIKDTPEEDIQVAEQLFESIKQYSFSPSDGYSYLLKSYKKFANSWDGYVPFIEWWNLSNFTPKDYKEFVTDKGEKIMPLAEQVYIAYSKALLKLNDKEKIQQFIPQIEKMVELYPNMPYFGYFCGKLMLALGAQRDETLHAIMPFVRKKKSEFWVWQLLSECYKDEAIMQQACLLRASHCKTKENFLGKIRQKLVSLYLAQKDYARAKFHLEKLVNCRIQNGWNIPYDVQDWLREPWTRTVAANNVDDIDYIQYTNNILQQGTTMSIAVVTYVDMQKKKASVIYGEKKRSAIALSKLPCKVKEGSLLKLYWIGNNENKISIVCTEPVKSTSIDCLSYIKKISGIIEKRADKNFAFLKGRKNCYYISPSLVEKYNLKLGDKTTAIAVYDYNKKKDEWTWSCLSIKKD